MITFRFRGDPRYAPAPRGDASDALRQEVADLTGLEIEIDETVDFEDWTEAAAQLVEVLKSGAETEIVWGAITGYSAVDYEDSPFMEFLDDNPEHKELFPEDQVTPDYESLSHRVLGSACAPAFMGALSTSDEREASHGKHTWPLPQNDVALRYSEIEAFQRHAGRKVVICDMPGGDPGFIMPVDAPLGGTGKQTSLEEALAAFEGQEVAVKQTRPLKAMPVRFVSVSPGEIKKAAHAVFEIDPYHVLHHEGDRNTLLVQEKIVLSRETRYFVADGVPVSGAGCIEAHTPLDRDPRKVIGVTHAVFETARNNGEVITDLDAAQRMEDFVRIVAADLQQELPELRHVVIDVALDGAGKPIVIEMNPYQNSGLYANDAAAVFEPVLEEVVPKIQNDDFRP